MQAPAIPENEAQRLAALQRLYILDTSAEERFDRLTRLAKVMFQVPTALVSLVDADRQWFKSRQGLDACETPATSRFAVMPYCRTISFMCLIRTWICALPTILWLNWNRKFACTQARPCSPPTGCASARCALLTINP
jgi:hypothetical protein